VRTSDENRFACHHSTFSRFGASGKLGAVQQVSEQIANRMTQKGTTVSKKAQTNWNEMAHKLRNKFRPMRRMSKTLRSAADSKKASRASGNREATKTGFPRSADMTR
jgi:hypothetical protein